MNSLRNEMKQKDDELRRCKAKVSKLDIHFKITITDTKLLKLQYHFRIILFSLH